MRRAALRSLFDFCGCVVACLGNEARWPPGRAGRLALLAHLRDQDDLHLGSVTHPGGVVWSAVIGCDESTTLGASIEAAAFGYELTVRLAEAAGPEARQRWHMTATAGTVGAAGAAARVLGADAVDAVAHAASVAGGSAQAMVERAGTRFLHRSHAADSGVACARAALSGLPASRGVIGGGRGVFGDLAGDPAGPRPEAVIVETGFRLHAANGFAHAAIEAASTLGPLAPEQVESVRVVVSPPAATVVASNPAPADDEEAWWSIEHAVAVSLSVGDPAAVRALCTRVELAPGDAGWGASVEVRLRDGTAKSASVTGPRPASDADLVAKWARLTGTDGAPFFERLQAAADDELLADVLPDLPR